MDYRAPTNRDFREFKSRMDEVLLYYYVGKPVKMDPPVYRRGMYVADRPIGIVSRVERPVVRPDLCVTDGVAEIAVVGGGKFTLTLHHDDRRMRLETTLQCSADYRFCSEFCHESEQIGTTIVHGFTLCSQEEFDAALREHPDWTVLAGLIGKPKAPARAGNQKEKKPEKKPAVKAPGPAPERKTAEPGPAGKPAARFSLLQCTARGRIRLINELISRFPEGARVGLEVPFTGADGRVIDAPRGTVRHVREAERNLNGPKNGVSDAIIDMQIDGSPAFIRAFFSCEPFRGVRCRLICSFDYPYRREFEEIYAKDRLFGCGFRRIDL